MPKKGRSAITEKCFTKNVLEFATNFTMIKGMDENGEGSWEKFEQNDLSEGTYPAGSVWRPVGKYLKTAATLRKDSVVVPATLVPGDYVLGWRWDSANGNQVPFTLGKQSFLQGKLDSPYHRSGCPVLP